MDEQIKVKMYIKITWIQIDTIFSNQTNVKIQLIETGVRICFLDDVVQVSFIHKRISQDTI